MLVPDNDDDDDDDEIVEEIGIDESERLQYEEIVVEDGNVEIETSIVDPDVIEDDLTGCNNDDYITEDGVVEDGVVVDDGTFLNEDIFVNGIVSKPYHEEEVFVDEVTLEDNVNEVTIEENVNEIAIKEEVLDVLQD